jgi:hypothetical protein
MIFYIQTHDSRTLLLLKFAVTCHRVKTLSTVVGSMLLFLEEIDQCKLRCDEKLR